jgi:hypothetical protein
VTASVTVDPFLPLTVYDRCMARATFLAAQEHPMPDLVFGRVPDPTDVRVIVTKAGPGNGYDLVPPRQIVGTCLHSTWGTGTVEWYAQFFGIGGERHDDALVDYLVEPGGRIGMLNDPRGTRSPWANGNARGLEGDGPAFVAALGSGAINARLVSIERVGRGEPMPPAQFEAVARLIAYVHDQARVPWDRFPFNPNVGCVTQMQHWEFSSDHTEGTGCPFMGVQGQTTAYQARVREIMRIAQTATVATTTTPTPATTTTAPPQLPGADARLPPGMTPAMARERFGVLTTARGRYAFDPTGSVSRLWVEEGRVTGRWPAIVAAADAEFPWFLTFADGGIVIIERDTPPRWLRVSV